MCLAIDNTVCFRKKTGPCQPTVIQPGAGVELPPLLRRAERADRQCVCGLEETVFQAGISARPSTALMEPIPVPSGTDLKVRYPDEAVSRWFEDGPGHDRPLRLSGPE